MRYSMTHGGLFYIGRNYGYTAKLARKTCKCRNTGAINAIIVRYQDFHNLFYEIFMPGTACGGYDFNIWLN